MKTMKSACAWTAAFLILLAATAAGTLCAQETGKKSILVLHSYHQGLGWTDSITKGLRAVFDASPFQADICYEYMDTKRIHDQAHLDMLADLFAHKYRNRRFDVIIVSDDHAFNFLRNRHQDLFPETPAVFCGVNYFKDEFIADDPYITGVVESFSIKGTIDAALGIHPNLRTVFSVVDDTVTGKANRKLLSEVMPLYAGRLQFEYIENMSMAAAREKAATLPDDSVALLLHFTSDSLGNVFSLEESADLITAQARRPVYSFWDFHLNHGVVGGKLTTGASQGRKAAELALRILGGENPADIPVIKESPNQYIFDYKVMQRFNIPESRLPQGSVVINKPRTFYEQHKRLFWEAAAAFAALCLIIVVCAAYLLKLRAARLRLEITEHRFQEIMNRAPAVIYIKDLQGRYAFVNSHFENLSGYGWKDVVGKTDFELFPREVADNSYANDRGVIAAGAPLEAEEIGPVKGEMHTFISAKFPIFDKNGRVNELCGISTDITDIKQARAELARTQALLHNVVEQSPVPMVVATPDGIIQIVNTACKKQLGIEDEPHIRPGMNLFEFKQSWTDYDSRGNVIPVGQLPLALALRGIAVKGKEIRIVAKDGTERWEMVHGLPIFDDDGNILAGFVIFPDITDIKKAEQIIRESERKYKTLLENLKDVIIRFDRNHRFLYVSPSFYNYLPLEEASLLGKTYAAMDVDTELKDFWQNNIQAVFDSGEPVETWFEVAQEERMCVFNWRLFPEFDAAGAIQSALSIIRDVTKHKQAEKEKARLEAQLLQSRKMEAVGTLAGGIAHDFNNILGIILGNAELAMDDVPEWHPARHNLEEVAAASLRAKDMIRQLLSFTRKSKHQRKPLKLSAVIMDSLKLLRTSIPSSVAISQNIADAHDTVLADATQIHQIMINLCANAAHAMQATGGTLTVELETGIDLDDQSAAQYPDLSPGRYIKLTVSDTGCGMDPDVRNRIFDPYFTTKDVGEGTGMGLAVVHGIVKSHGGAISAYSEPGKGSRFNVLFPSIAEEAAAEARPDEAEAPRGHEAVLFVDDEAALADMGKQMLTRLGYRVEACLNPVEALDIFAAGPDRFDLLITDMTMPGMTGDRLAGKVLAIRPDMPVIMCTGYSRQISEEEAAAIGVKAFIMKPLVRRDLAVTVRRVLDARENDLEGEKDAFKTEN